MTRGPQVTRLDRDPASGTALQEISFWLNLERALLRIQEKRDSLEVALTLDVLRHGKRFHATISFDADTGNSARGDAGNRGLWENGERHRKRGMVAAVELDWEERAIGDRWSAMVQLHH